MAEGRRYGEDEVRQILDLATEATRPAGASLSSGEGLTLQELEEIGGEVGLEPGRIAEAARALEARGALLPRRTLLGMPISAGRVVELPRAATDEEWALLVAELRSTFGARGKLGGQGNMREWWNSNLHASVEPTEEGYRLRLGTLKGSAAPYTALGLTGLGMALIMLVVFALTGRLGEEMAVSLMLGLMGGGALAYNALTLPRWATVREEQMEHIARRAIEIVGPAQALDAGDEPVAGA